MLFGGCGANVKTTSSPGFVYVNTTVSPTEIVRADGLIVPTLLTLTLNVDGEPCGGAAVTTNETWVEWLAVAPVPVTVICEVPAGVEPVVVIVIVAEQLGVHEISLNDAAAPDGKPDAPKETGSAAPAIKLRFIVAVPWLPA